MKKASEIKVKVTGRGKLPSFYEEQVIEKLTNETTEYLGFAIESDSEWAGAHTKLKLKCTEHGVFETTSYNNFMKGRGCPECGKNKNHKNTTFTTVDFVKNAKEVHGDSYDYSKVVYINAQTHVTITCKKHDTTFDILPVKHVNCKQGCNECGIERTTIPKDEALARITSIHGGHFSFPKDDYIAITQPMTVYCNKTEKEYRTTPKVLISGGFCRFCSPTAKIDTSDFIRSARLAHGNLYSYDSVNYVDIRTKVDIICPTHGVFSMVPTTHIHGHKSGCPKCGKYGYQPTQPGTFYLQKLVKGDRVLYKFGITGDLERRITEQSRDSCFEHSVLISLNFDDGTIPLSIEREIKELIQEGAITSDELKSGFTETFEEIHLDSVMMIIERYK